MAQHSERHTPPQLSSLIDALRKLPGVGPKSAQRMAFHLLQHDRGGAMVLGQALLDAARLTSHCIRCNSFTNSELCSICADPARDPRTLCVVETPADLLTIEATATYRGLYFVLMGRCSPLEGIGPDDIAIGQLLGRVDDGLVVEVILANNFTNEGEATAFFLSERLRHAGLQVSRLARGVPIGGELEYTDPGTVARALLDRRIVGASS